MGRAHPVELTSVLSESDLLRLNVLLTQSLHAVRIDESKLHLEALTERGEARVTLHPTERADAYLREVRAWLSARILGSPGGYPLYIRRWTRMGQARDGSLERLLLLGEPEAVAAVVHAPKLTPELARRAWWVEPSAEHARQMLDRPEVAADALGATLTAFLLDYLPFEEQPRDVIASVQRILRHAGLSEAQHADLWRRAQRQSAYAVGFLAAGAEHVPAGRAAHPRLEAVRARLAADADNPLAARLLHALSAAGQNFLAGIRLALHRPPNQDVAVALFNTIGHGFALPRTATDFRTFQELDADARSMSPQAAWEADDALAELRLAVLRLSRVGESLLDPIFGVTDAVGSVMRRKMAPAAQPIIACLDCLDGHA